MADLGHIVGVGAFGDLMLKNQRIGAIGHGIGKVADFGPGWVGVAFHGVHEFRGDHDNLGIGIALGDDLFLRDGQTVGMHNSTEFRPAQVRAINLVKQIRKVCQHVFRIDLDHKARRHGRMGLAHRWANGHRRMSF